jgi:hypothetical protein
MKRKIPMVGIPPDANRCMRWMGRFEQTSVNLERPGREAELYQVRNLPESMWTNPDPG